MATSSLASLVVSLEANIAKFSTDMTSAAAVTQRTMTGIQDAIGKAKQQFLGLAASVVSVGAAVQSVKGAIALGDELKTMSDATGIAVAKLDQLSIVAKLNGASLDDMAKGFKGIGKSIIESQDSTSKSAQLFQALGVAVKDSAGNLRGVEDVMGDVAKALNSIENETTRAAVGTAIFGKSYLQIAATLRNFEADQKAANEVLEKFGGVSVQAANLSDELGDKLTLLGEGSKRALLSGLVPGLAAASQAIQEVINAGGSFQTSFGDVISKVVEFVSSSLVSLKGAFQVVGVTIAAVAASIATGSLQPLKDLPGEIAKIEAQVIASQGRIRAAAAAPGLDDSDQISRRAGAQERLNKTQADGAKLAKILGDSTKGAKSSIEDFADEILKLQDEMNKLAGGTDGGYPRMLAAQEKIRKALLDGKDVTNEAIDAYIAAARALDEQEQAAKKLAATWENLEKAVKDAADAQREIDDAIYKANQSIKAQNDALELEHATLGLTDNARQQFITRLALEKAQVEGNTNAILLLTKQLDLLAQQAADRTFLDMVQQTRQALEQTTAFFSDFFVDLFNNGTKAFKNLWESFKQLAFRAMADVAAKQLVVSLTGAGAATVTGAANAGGLGGLLQGAGSLLSGGFGGGGGLLGATGFGGAQTAAIDSALITSGFSSLAGGTITAALGPVVAALPWAGLAAIAIPMIGKLFGKGPSNRSATFGSGDLGSDASRDLAFSSSSAFGNFGIISDKHLNQKDVGANAAFGTLLSSIQALDNTIAGMVGGDLTKQIADALARHTVTVGLGKEKTDVGASGGPLEILKDRYVTVLGAIDARLGTLVQSFEGTGDELANFVVGLLALRQQLGATFDSLDADQISALGDAFGGLDKLAGSLSFLNANFTSEADKAIESQQQLVDSFSQLGLAVPATHKAFVDLLSSFDLTTDSGRELYASVMGLSGAFVAVNGTATQAMESLRASIAGLEDARAAYLGTGQQAASQNTLNALVGQFAGSREWAQQIVNASGVTGLVSTLSQIVQSDFANYSASDQGLITAILNAGAAARPQQQAGGTIHASDAYAAVFGSSTGGTSSVAAADTSQEQVAKLLQMFANLAGQSTGDYGEKLALQIRLVTGAISDAGRFSQTAALLRNTNAEFAASLALFNDLSTRYGDSIAEQLVKLTESYNAQAKGLKGNAVGLDVLHQVFEEQWAAIINGTAAGVDGTMDQLRRLQQGILDYVDSLKIGADSPLTASQKLDLARSQYESDLTKASSGDQTALGEITRSADAYIKLARDFYASSSAYTDLFNSVTGQLTGLANPGGVMSSTDMQAASTFVTTARTAAPGVPLPTPPAPGTDAAVATAKDVRDMASVIVEAIYEAAMLAAKSSADDAGKVSESVDRSKAALVEAISVGLK